ncbi:MAG: hypothetical protein ABSD13_01085 [Candidatus Korobacteraceae bacterium]|jgi:HD-like signal output (HDOD) protein
MTTSHPASSCRVISIASAFPDAAEQSHSVLALIRVQRAFNLAEIAESIRADGRLSHLVAESACLAFGYHRLSIEEAIVLLGSQRLCSLLSCQHRHGRSAKQFRSALYLNSITTAANLSLLEMFQEEAE